MATNPPPSPLDLVAGRRDWRVMLEREYQPVAERLVGAYNRVLPELQARARALVAEAQRVETLTGAPAQIPGLRTYADLIARIEVEMQDFAAVARFESGALADGAVRLGVQGALDGVTAQSNLASQAWMRPDPEALSRLIGYADSDAMRIKFARFGVNAAGDFADLMVALTAQGKNARFIARAVEGWLNVPFVWAETMARTTQNYSYRGATAASYRANAHLLDGWLWRAALDVRTCMSCIAQHGSIHPISEMLNDHHRGRCAMVPVVKGSTWATEVERGEGWYGRLPEGAQRRMAGDLLFTALRSGDAAWSDLSKAYDDDVFGTMLREASVRDLVPDERRYTDLRVRAAGLPANGVSFERAALIAAETRAG